MELKDFTKKIISDIVQSVDEVSSESRREIRLHYTKEARTIEFDIAITVERSDRKKGDVGVKVIEFVQGQGEMTRESKNSTVSRVKFGVNVSGQTKAEEAALEAQHNAAMRRINPNPAI